MSIGSALSWLLRRQHQKILFAHRFCPVGNRPKIECRLDPDHQQVIPRACRPVASEGRKFHLLHQGRRANRNAANLRRSRCEPRFNVSQYFDQTNHVGLLEYAFNTVAVEVGEWSFIEEVRVHHPARCQMLDNKVEEFQLIRGQPAAIEELSESALGSLPIEPYQCADETREPAVGLERNEPGFINASLKKYTLQLLQIGRRQRLVAPHLEHGDVIFVRLEKHPRLAAERIHVGADHNAWH